MFREGKGREGLGRGRGGRGLEGRGGGWGVREEFGEGV